MTLEPGSIVIVTGGSRGIGSAIVARLRDNGCRVVTCGRGMRPSTLEEDVLWVQTDVADTADTKRLVKAALNLGPIALLVNNAGVQCEESVLNSTDADWANVVDINCKGVFNMCRAVLPGMTEKGGVIVNIGSIAGNVSETSMALYNASKAFVHSLTRSVAVDHGPEVRCNAVCPGWIITGLSESAFDVARDPETAKADALARHPTRRLGTPEDVAKAVSWLASAESEFVTGQCITLDGGLTSATPFQPKLF